MSAFGLKEKKLLYREWLIVSAFFALIGMLFFTAWASEGRARLSLASSLVRQPEEVCIIVEGAVRCPGSYQFPSGTTLKKVLHAAQMTKKADRAKLDLKRSVFHSCRIYVPEKEPHSSKNVDQR